MLFSRASQARDCRGVKPRRMVGPSTSGLALAGVAHLCFSSDRSSVFSSAVDGMENSHERNQKHGAVSQSNGFVLHGGNGGSYVQ